MLIGMALAHSKIRSRFLTFVAYPKIISFISIAVIGFLCRPVDIIDIHGVPAGGLGWSDVGSWDSLFDVLEADRDGNVHVNCEVMPIQTHNSLAYAANKKLIVTIGVDDLIIIDSGDALLVCRRDQAQQVRQVIDDLKKSKKENYL